MTIKKISISVLIVFLIVFSLLVLFQFFSRSYIDIFYLQDQFYSQDLKHTKKIFIVGSSETAVLNNTHINNYFKTNEGSLFDVYNLSVASDQPSARLQTIEKIIKMKPDVIIYGVGYRDFANQFTLIKQKNDVLNQLLPDPQSRFDSFLKHTNSEFDLIKSPKFVTEKVLDAIINNIKHNNPEQLEETITQPKTPFYKYKKEHGQINQKITVVESIGHLDIPAVNDEVIALKKIITRLQENNIKIILFTTPYSKPFFNNLNDHNRDTFEQILVDLSDEYDISIYRLHDKYQDLDVWNDYNHIAMNPASIIFTEDIEEIISKEI